jgi:CRP-like cAMP-binding protein
MSNNEFVQLMSRSPVFNGLDEAIFADVFARANLRTVQAGGAFFHQGDPAIAFYILTAGHVKLVRVTPDGHQILSRFVGSGQEFGITSTLSGFAHPMSAQAIENCQALVWAGEVLAQMMEEQTGIALNVVRVLTMRNLQLQHRYQELLTESVEQRLAQALLNLLSTMGRDIDNGTLIDMPLTEEDLAALTGTTMYTVSRMLNKWQRAGLVEATRRRIVVCCPDALKRVATHSAAAL